METIKTEKIELGADGLPRRPSMEELKGREFRHFKGNRYELTDYAKDSETTEWMVVYRQLYGEGLLWVRPAKMFFETISRDGETFPRFQLIAQSK